VHKRIFILAEQIDRKDTWSQTSSRLESLKDYLDKVGQADGILPQLQVLMYGSKSIKPLIELFKE
jgi:hypothetical protein